MVYQSDAETLGTALASMTKQRDEGVRLLDYMTKRRDRLEERLAEVVRLLERE